MVTVSAAVLTRWETPETIESLGTEIKQNAASFKGEIDDAGMQWNRLQSAYTGPGQETLYAALDPVITQGEFIRDAGELAHGALEEFVSSLRALRQERTELLGQVGEFNREHSGDSLEDLDSMETTQRTNLDTALQSLQQRYEDLTATCAAALNQIRVGNVSEGELDNTTAFDELTSWSNYSSGALNVLDVQTTVEGLEEIQVTRDGSVMSEQLVDSYEERSHRLTMFGEPVGRGTPTNAWNTLLADSGVGANPTTTPMERLSTQFSGRFMDALPGAGLATSTLATFGRQGTTTSQRNPGRVTTSTDSQGRETQSQVRHTQETRSGQLRNAGNFALRSGGVLTTGYSAYANFNSRQDERQMQLAQENPEMSAEEINTEATHDAAAFSAGATGASVAAAAGAGAAAGSLVPGPGNAVGFVVGLGAGIATEVDFLPPIPGQEGSSSISDYVGYGAETFWGGARSVGSDIADTVSESSLNPVNWF